MVSYDLVIIFPSVIFDEMLLTLKTAVVTVLLFFAGRLVASLITDFLHVFNLDFTLAVFQPEINTVF